MIPKHLLPAEVVPAAAVQIFNDEKNFSQKAKNIMSPNLSPVPKTTVPFFEMGGSPTEVYTTEGFRATRKFLVAWDDRDAFAQDVMGSAAEYDYSHSTFYPERPWVIPISLTFKPVDDYAVVKKMIAEMHADVNSYSGSWAIATVEYETLGTQDTDSVEIGAGTRLAYRLNYDPREVVLPVTGWKWSGTEEALPDDTILVRRIPQTLHILTWSLVVSPPWRAIQEAQGKINAGEFLDSPPGTLLLEGIGANKLFRSTLEKGASNFTWQIIYTFRQLCVHHAGQTYGWNHLFRGSNGTWTIPVNNGVKLYDETDFAVLFRPE